jgi:hypothetical protein
MASAPSAGPFSHDFPAIPVPSKNLARRTLLALALGCASIGAASPSTAQQLNAAFQGRVTILTPSSPAVQQQFDQLGITVGAELALDFAVDTTVPGVPTTPERHYVYYEQAVVGFNLRVGAYHATYQFSTNGNSAQVGNDVPNSPSLIADSYVVTALGAESPQLLKGSGPFDILGFSSVFADADGRTIANHDLMQDLRRFTFGSGAVGGSNGGIGFVLDVAGGRTPKPESIREFLYVHDGPSAELRVFGLGSRTGAATEIAGSPFAIPGGPVSCASATRTLAIDSRGEWLFASTGSGLAVFRRDRRSGWLELLGSAPIGATDELAGIALLQKGSTIWIYAADRGPSTTARERGGPTNGKLRIFRFDSRTATGELLSADLDLGPTGSQGGVAVTKSFVYATTAADPSGGIHCFALDARTGLLTPTAGSPFFVGGAPSSLLRSKKGDQLVINSETQARYDLLSLDASTGLSPSSRSFNSSSPSTRIFAADKSFRFVYGGGDEGFDVLPTRLGSTSSIATADPIDDGALNKKGTLLYAVSGNDLVVYPIEKRTGLPVVSGNPVVLTDVVSGRSTGVVLR